MEKIKQLIEANKLEEALDYLTKACEKNPSAQLLNQKALLEKKLGHTDQALESLKAAIDLSPDYAASYNHLGLIFHHQSQFEKAEHYFEQALKCQPNYLDALYNLALSLKVQNKITECSAALTAIIDVNPNYLPAQFLLAKTFLEKNKPLEANDRFIALAKLTHYNQAVLFEIIQHLLNFDRFIEAEPFCERALKQEPRNHHLLYNLGVIRSRKRDIDGAIHAYLQALDIEADSFETLNNLGVLYLEKQQVETAKFYLQKALTLKPDNKALQHTVAAVSGDQTLQQASNEYITQLFDHYADHFDEHLNQGLDYQVPDAFFEILQQFTNLQPRSVDFADLGCGTGLVAERLKPLARSIIGVDLSSKMLAKAKQKQLYDTLVEQDNTAFLHDKENTFDCITAADVFVYQGNLESIFMNAFSALKPNGYFIFSTELAVGDHFELSPSGRFHHGKHYIQTLADNIGFQVLSAQAVATRMQHDKPVGGMVYLLAKTV